MSDQARANLPHGFYSAVPQERVAALGRTTSELREVLMADLPSWPRMSPGSLNAWLVFLGASPGNSPGGPWNYDPLPSVGAAHGGISEYEDRKSFWKGIRGFARTIFPELSPKDAYAATMVRNLVCEQSATAPKGPRMHRAASQVMEPLGKLIRPRLIIALGEARKYTAPAFRKLPSVDKSDSGSLYTSNVREERKWFSLRGDWESGAPFLFVSPSGIHPSLFHVSREDTLEFLRQQSTVARSL